MRAGLIITIYYENKVGLTKFSLKWLQIQKEKVRVKHRDLHVLIG